MVYQIIDERSISGFGSLNKKTKNVRDPEEFSNQYFVISQITKHMGKKKSKFPRLHGCSQDHKSLQ